MLEQCLAGDPCKGAEGEGEGEGLLTAQSIMQARSACKLPALTGGAPVYYGLPKMVFDKWSGPSHKRR